MTTLTNDEKIEAIMFWQSYPLVHNLTCEHGHGSLVPDIVDGNVVLKCESCDYVQTWIPEYVYQMYLERDYHMNELNRLQSLGYKVF